jgi:hypothetical protein
MKLSSLKIDSARLERGAWIGDIPELEGVRFHVRGAGNADWRRLQAKLVAGVPAKERRNGLDVVTRDRIETRCLLDACLLDWSGLEEDDGQPVAFSRETAERYLTDPDYAVLRAGVVYAANLVADVETEAAEQTLGNSSPA